MSIPFNPKAKTIIPQKNRRTVPIPTYSGGLTARNTYNAPGQMGTGLTKIIDNVTETAQQIDKRMAVAAAQQKGQREQELNPDYVAPGTPFTLTGQAYQKGANTAFITRKEREYKTKLQQIGFDNPNDLEKYDTAVNEYKDTWLSTLPQNLQNDLSIEYDKSAFNVRLRLDAEIRTRKYESERKELQDEYEQQAYAITNILSNNDMDFDPMSETYWSSGTGYADIFAKMKTLETTLKESYGLSEYEILTIKKKARTPILSALITKEFETRADDPEARDKFIESVKNGTYNMDNFGDVYGSVIPGSSTISAQERFLLGTELDKLKDNTIKANKSMLSGSFENNSEFGKQIKSGKIFTRDENNRIILKDLDNINEELLLSQGATEQQIVDQKLLRKADIIVGNYTYKAIITANTKDNEIIADITAQKVLLEKSTDITDNQKVVLLNAYDDAIASVQKINKDKIEFTNNGEMWEYAAQKLDVSIDPSNAETLDQTLPQIADMYNVPFAMISAPKEASEQMGNGYEILENDRDAVQYLATEKEKYKKYFGAMLVSWAKYSKDNANYVATVIADLATTDYNQAVYLQGAYKNKELYQEQGEKIAGKNWNKTTKKVTQDFVSQFDKKLDPESPFYQAIENAHSLVFYREFAKHGDYDKAKVAAQSFINQNYVTLDLANGSQILTPKYIYNKDGEALDTQPVIDLADSILEQPHKYNIKLGLGETLDDFRRDSKNYGFGWHNGGISFYQKGDGLGFEATRIYQKLPSGQNQLLYADSYFTVGNEILVTEDAEKSWNMDIRKNWLSDWKFDKTITKEIYTTDEVGIETVDYVNVNQDNDEWAKDFAEYWIDTMTEETAPNVRVSKYEDSFVPILFPAYAGNEDVNKLAIGNAISMALRSPDLKKDTFLRSMTWLSGNSEYLSFLGRKDVQEALYEKWTKNLEAHSQRQTFNDAPTTMTVLQSLTDVAFEVFEEQKAIANYNVSQYTGS